MAVTTEWFAFTLIKTDKGTVNNDSKGEIVSYGRALKKHAWASDGSLGTKGDEEGTEG